MTDQKHNNTNVTASPFNKNDAEEKKSFWRINKDMLPYKLHFFLLSGAMGTLLPYQSAFAITKLGLTASNLGLVYTVLQFLAIVLKPLVGYVADYFNRLSAVIIGLASIQGILWLAMLCIPTPHISVPRVSEKWVSGNRNESLCNLCKGIEDHANTFSNMKMANDEVDSELLCNDAGNAYHIMCSSPKTNFSLILHEKFCYGPLNFQTDKNSSLRNLEKSFSNIMISQNGFLTTNIMCSNVWLFNSTIVQSTTDKCYSLPLNTKVNAAYIFHTAVTSCVSIQDNLTETEYNTALTSANFRTYQFWIFGLVMIISNTCVGCLFNMSDTALQETVQRTKGDYGKQRLWGPLNFGVIAPIAGVINDYEDNYFASWGLMVVFYSLQFWNLTKMDTTKPNFSRSEFKDLKTVLGSKDFLVFELGVLVNGMATGIVWFYLPWFILHINGNSLVIGVANTIQCYMGEIPFMFFSGVIIKKLGYFNVVSLAVIAHGVRFVLYAYVYDPWWIMPIEILHGLTYGSFLSAMTGYGKISSKPGTEATTQSVISSTFEGLGVGLGCVFSGICFDHFGSHPTFFYAGLFFIFAGAVNVFLTVLLKCRRGSLDVTKAEKVESGRF